MTRSGIFDVIAEILRNQMGCEVSITPDLDLQGDAQLDSLDLLTLVVEIENRFEIILEDAGESVRLDHLVEQVFQQVEKRQAGSVPASEAMG